MLLGPEPGDHVEDLLVDDLHDDFRGRRAVLWLYISELDGALAVNRELALRQLGRSHPGGNAIVERVIGDRGGHADRCRPHAPGLRNVPDGQRGWMGTHETRPRLARRREGRFTMQG